MHPKTRVAILDDHQSIIDGYLHRLSNTPDIEVVATASFGEELEPLLAGYVVDVLLLDIAVPIASNNANPYPILHTMPHLLQVHPDLHILAISMHSRHTLIKAVMDAGASGYVLKDDRETIQKLGAVIRTIANGGIYFSQQTYQRLKKYTSETALTPRQLEALSLCAAYPDISTAELAKNLTIAHSTLRNLLSSAYTKLEVQTRTAAVLKARDLNLITPLEQTTTE